MRFLILGWICLLTACVATVGAETSADAYEGGLVLKSEGPSAPREWRGLENPAGGAPATKAAADAEHRPQEPEPVVPGVPRLVIYSGSLELVVVSATDAVRRVQEFAEAVGGWLQASDSASITVRVPADKFEAVLARIATLGEVVERSVRASDVTEELFDLDLRLANARKTRDRLLEHLAQSTKIEDTLKIEAELARVSGEIERMEGRQRFVQSQVAMSTIRVALNTLVHEPRSNGGIVTPFAWLAELGDGLVAGHVAALPKKPSFFSRGPRFDPPRDFIRYFSRDDLVEALNADGLRLKVQKHANYDEGAAAFWAKLARQGLVQGRALAVALEQDLGEGRTLLRGTREVAGVPCGYLLVLLRTKDHVHSFEAWGPQAAFDPAYAALVASAKSLQR